jgi:hypothetical protein
MNDAITLMLTVCFTRSGTAASTSSNSARAELTAVVTTTLNAKHTSSTSPNNADAGASAAKNTVPTLATSTVSNNDTTGSFTLFNSAGAPSATSAVAIDAYVARVIASGPSLRPRHATPRTRASASPSPLVAPSSSRRAAVARVAPSARRVSRVVHARAPSRARAVRAHASRARARRPPRARPIASARVSSRGVVRVARGVVRVARGGGGAAPRATRACAIARARGDARARRAPTRGRAVARTSARRGVRARAAATPRPADRPPTADRPNVYIHPYCLRIHIIQPRRARDARDADTPPRARPLRAPCPPTRRTARRPPRRRRAATARPRDRAMRDARRARRGETSRRARSSRAETIGTCTSTRERREAMRTRGDDRADARGGPARTATRRRARDGRVAVKT